MENILTRTVDGGLKSARFSGTHLNGKNLTILNDMLAEATAGKNSTANIAKTLAASDKLRQQQKFVESRDVLASISGSPFLKPEVRTQVKKEINVNNSSLSNDDIFILATFSRLLYYYPVDQLDAELIVIIPELLIHGISEEKVAEYFGPLMEYWNKTIHKYAEKITLLSY